MLVCDFRKGGGETRLREDYHKNAEILHSSSFYLNSVSFSVFSLIVMIMFQFKYKVYFHCGKTLGILISHLLSNIYSGSKIIIRYLIIFSYESQGMGSLKAFHLQHLEKKIM